MRKKGKTGIKELRLLFRRLRHLKAKVISEKKRRFPDPEESYSGVIIITLNPTKLRLVAVGANCRQGVIVIIDHLPNDKKQAVKELVLQNQINVPY
ncbi:MAG: hypothetical protein ACOCU8_01945 [Patescibacteria group bacterium]